MINTNIKLARYYDSDNRLKIITIEHYEDLIVNKEKALIAEFVYERLNARYIKPFLFNNSEYKRYYKNGFAIMASSCLLIETLESFINGWGDSNRKSELAFKLFF